MIFSLIFIGLPTSAWLGLYLLCRRFADRGTIPADRRFSFTLASAGWGVVLVIITETLSVLSQVHRTGVTGAWLCATAIIWAVCVRRGPTSEFRGMIRSESRRLLWLMKQPATWPLDMRLKLQATLLKIISFGTNG